MNIDIDAVLRRLHLANTRRIWRDLCAQAEKEQWTYQHLLEVLFAEEVAHSPDFFQHPLNGFRIYATHPHLIHKSNQVNILYAEEVARPPPPRRTNRRFYFERLSDSPIFSPVRRHPDNSRDLR